MNDIEYISVSEFAKKANVSRQTIYNRLNSDLTNFVKEDLQTGRKNINTKALILFDNGQSNGVKEVVKIDRITDNEESGATHNKDSKVNENLTLLIETLQSQLKEKNKQIDELKNEKKELKEELKQVNEHSRNLSNDLIELNRNQQILLKQSQDKVLELETPKESIFQKLKSKTPKVK